MRKGKDPEPDTDPYLRPMDPDPGGPNISGSGSPTMVIAIMMERLFLPYPASSREKNRFK